MMIYTIIDNLTLSQFQHVAFDIDFAMFLQFCKFKRTLTSK